MADGDCVGDGEAPLVNISVPITPVQLSASVVHIGLDWNSIIRC